ncbi:MAG: hypothetical protein ABIR33_09650 [Pyrinomonadaceae bacterium]
MLYTPRMRLPVIRRSFVFILFLLACGALAFGDTAGVDDGAGVIGQTKSVTVVVK